jgi:O-antigen/teichoic acid export membrane protein
LSELLQPAVLSPAVVAESDRVAEPHIGRSALAKGFAWNAAFGVLSKVIFPLAGLYIVRTLGPQLLGIAALLQMTLSLSEVLREAGLTQTYLAEKSLTEELDATYVGASILSGLIPSVGVLLLTPYLTGFFNQPELLWSLPFVSACLFMNGIGSIPNARLLKKADFKRQGSIAVTASGVGLAVTSVLVALGVRFPALVVQFSVGATINLILSLRREPITRASFKLAPMKPILRRTRALAGANLLNNLFLYCDVFVLKKMVGTVAAGLYNTTQIIAYKPIDLILFPLNKTLMVSFSQAKHDQDRLKDAYWRALSGVVLLILPMYAFLAANADGIVLGLLGKQFQGGIPILEILCLYLACRTLGSTSGVALVPAQKHSWTFYPWLVALAVTSTGVWLNSRHPTTLGIVWSFTSGAVSVYLLIFFLAIVFIRPTRLLVRRFLSAGVVTLGTCASIALFHMVEIPVFVRLAVSAGVVPIIHLSLAGLVFEKNPAAYLSRNGVRKLWHRL